MDVYIRYTSLSSSHIPMILNFHILAFSSTFYQQIHMKKKNKSIGEKRDTRDTRKKKERRKKKTHLPTRSRCHRSHLSHTKNGTSKPHQRDQIHPNHSRQSPIGKDITRRRQDRSPCHHQSGREAENGDKGEVSSEFLLEKREEDVSWGYSLFSLLSFLGCGGGVVVIHTCAFPMRCISLRSSTVPFFSGGKSVRVRVSSTATMYDASSCSLPMVKGFRCAMVGFGFVCFEGWWKTKKMMMAGEEGEGMRESEDFHSPCLVGTACSRSFSSFSFTLLVQGSVSGLSV